MIFMSQSGLADRSREREWAAWYVEHLALMLSVPGVLSAQRFQTESIGQPRSLAMYTMVSEDVFTDPQYQRVRGMGAWAPLIDRAHYRRNLFDGLESAPEVREDQVLVVADRSAPGEADFEVSMSWLAAVAVDRSTPYRGIAVLPPEDAARLTTREGLGIYVPVTPFQRKP